MIGHMILRKYYDGEDILGLKVIGGQPLPYATSSNDSSGSSGGGGGCGAFVEKVKRGSVADVEGHIRPGMNDKKKNQKQFSLFPSAY